MVAKSSKRLIALEKSYILENKKIDRKSSIIIIPDITMIDNINNFLKFLVYNKSNILGIAYAGTAPNYVKKICMELIHCFFWDESYCNLYEIPNMGSFVSRIPIIRFESVLIKDISMVKRIKDIFLKEGYTSMIVSDLPHSYFSGVDYVKEGIINENLLIYYELYYSLDLIFVFSKKSNGYNFDIKIVATEKEIKVSSYRKNISWKREGVLLDSRNIYQIIKRIFA